MEKKKIIQLLKKVRSGQISVNEGFLKLRHLPYEDLGFAKVDHHRLLRTNLPEVIFCAGKSAEQIAAIFSSLARENKKLLLTRANEDIFKRIKEINSRVKFNPLARAISLEGKRPERKGRVAIVCAGTADIPIAEEAAVTASVFGSRVEKFYDVGVAGLHRLLGSLEKISRSRCVVVIAGMDGVLPSVIGGLVSVPVIAVPASVGYGANFNGIAPLLTMLNSCAPGVSVVNINNGFGAGYIASVINAGKR
jgi:pyridinium-3,5-biscarboxylic acid mononucleotide synthase